MITRIAALLILPAFALCPAVAGADLKVHEWGTFTTLSDSQGRALQWYSPQSEHSALPRFVRMDGMFRKNVMRTTVRMETPVIYFYPSEPMEVEVQARFNEGGISEFYPDKAPLQQGEVISFSPGGMISMPARWKGRLLPPDDKKGLQMIPAVSSGERGAHYAAARKVPDAWIFHHQAEVFDAKVGKTVIEDQADKFIFYRGAGNFVSGLSFSSSAENQILIANNGAHAHPLGVLLQVKNNQARWNKMPEVGANVKEGVILTTQITGAWQTIDAVEAELTHWFQATLTSEGLTPDEASAMVATWHGSWFREPGLRAFTLMPRAQVDEVLPLNIQPVPSDLKRVFVNRHEMVAAAQEEELATLISDPRISDEDARKRLKQLELGRFQDAAMQSALDIARLRMQMRYSDIIKIQNAEPSVSSR